MTIRRAYPAVALLLLAAPSPADDGVPGLRVPPGFAVREVAGSDLANDIQCMTVGDDGRIIVSGRGYISILIDDDGDGRADRADRFADGPRDGAMGLLREGDTLYATGDGGLRRYRDRDGDDRADGPSELVRAVKTGGEHDAHAVRRGPDGWLYLIVGNFAGVDAAYASLPTSPIRDPVAGCLAAVRARRLGDRDRRRRLPQRLRLRLRPRGRGLRLRLGQRAVRVAPLVRADPLLPRRPRRPSRLAGAPGRRDLADAPVVRGRRPAGRLRRPGLADGGGLLSP